MKNKSAITSSIHDVNFPKGVFQTVSRITLPVFVGSVISLSGNSFYKPVYNYDSSATDRAGQLLLLEALPSSIPSSITDYEICKKREEEDKYSFITYDASSNDDFIVDDTDYDMKNLI